MSRAVVFAYSSVGYECLKTLIDAGVEIPVVYTHEDDPNEEIWFKSVRDLALANGLNVLTKSIKKDNLAEELERVKNAAPDVIFSFYYRKIIPWEVLALAPLGAFNMHGALLPKYRGRAPVNWAVLNGETETGMTLHRMTLEADRGDIIAQRRVAIGPDDTALDVFQKLIPEAGAILREVLPGILAGNATGTPQDETQATSFGRRRPEDGLIDWNKSAREIHNLVRAVTWPFPGAFALLPNPDALGETRKLMVWKTRVTEDQEQITDALSGTVVATSPLKVATGEGLIEIIEAQWVDNEQVKHDKYETMTDNLGLSPGDRFGFPCRVTCDL